MKREAYIPAAICASEVNRSDLISSNECSAAFVLSAMLSPIPSGLRRSRLAKLRGTYCTELGVLSFALLNEIGKLRTKNLQRHLA